MNLVYILQKPHRERNTKDIRIVAYHLEQTELKKKGNGIGDSKGQQKLFFFMAINLNYLFLEKGDLLFKQGDRADHFYILLKGRCIVLKDTSYNSVMIAEDYLNFVSKLFNKRKLVDKARETIKNNKSVYPINEKDLPILHIHIFITLLRKLISTNATAKKIQNLFIKYDVNPTFFSINFNILDNMIMRNDYLFNILEKIIQYFFGKTTFDFDLYWYVIHEKANDVLISDCTTFLSINTGKVFGEMALDNQTNIR